MYYHECAAFMKCLKEFDKAPASREETKVRMHVALLTPYPPARDGIAFYSEQLSNALKAIGVKVHVLTWEIDASDRIVDQERVEVIKISPPTSFGFTSSVTTALVRLCPDVVHVQYSFRRGLYGWGLGVQLLPIFFALHKLGTPLVVTVHDIWSRSDLLSRFGRNVLVMPKTISYFMYLHALSKFLFTYADAIICHSHYLEDLLNSEYKIGYGKMFVIEHGVPSCQVIDSDEAKSKMNIKAKYVLLNFGMMWEAKGLDHLVQAMKYVVEALPSVHLIIAGQPYKKQYVEQLLNLSKRIGLEEYISIHAKFIKEDQVPLYFSASSLVITPYIYSTGVSGVIRLAFAFEKPVVATLNPLRAEELGVDQNARGVLASLDNPRELARAITKLLKNGELYEELKQNVKVFKIKNDWKNIAKQTSEIYRRVLQTSSHRRC